MIVTKYGIIDTMFGEMMFDILMIDFKPEQKPNSKHAHIVPSGENLPKITAEIAIKPCPTITLGRYWLIVAVVTNAPPRPEKKPERITQM